MALDMSLLSSIDLRPTNALHSSARARRQKKYPVIAILEDGDEHQHYTLREEPLCDEKSGLIAGPRRLRLDLISPVQRKQLENGKSGTSDKMLSSRTSALSFVESSMAKADRRGLDLTPRLGKEPRRRTIWAPSDDTTIMTIHPGAYTHTLRDETLCVPKPLTAWTSPIAGPSPVPPKRKSTAAAPKRAPLAHRVPTQPNAVFGDIAGSGLGKENFPPGHVPSFAAKKASSTLSVPIKSHSKPLATSNTASKRTTFLDATETSRGKTHDKPVHKVFVRHTRSLRQTSACITTGSKPSCDMLMSVRTRNTKKEDKIASTTSSNSSDKRIPKQPSFAAYSILPLDLSRADMYEQSWLDHQEVALTQVVNTILGGSDIITASDSNTHGLRADMVDLYQSGESVTLSKRLAASLQFGALALPKDSCPPKVYEDVGLREQFLDLWLRTYDRTLLKAGLEVIVGREIGLANSTSSRASTIGPSKAHLRQFIEVFFLRAEDLTNVGSRSPDEAKIWRTTVLRGLLLINLLDRAKQVSIIKVNLFRTTSVHKTSENVVRALARLCLPSLGDISRPLRHFGYTTACQQLPVQEYGFVVKALAADLRDGIILSRLFELCRHESVEDPAQTPDGMTTQSNQLISKLVYPCGSRTQKLHNVQLVLDAIEGSGAFPESVSLSLTAEDIVDGHREKTLGLIWALLSHRGLSLLLGGVNLGRELKHLEGMSRLGQDKIHRAMDAGDLEDMLYTWASLVCRTSGVEVGNLSTSFATSRPLEVIVSHYISYLPDQTFKSTASIGKGSPLSRLLETIGCSKAFITLCASRTTRIPSRSTTLSILAFLASRLLTFTLHSRAASTIQHAWRLHRGKRDFGKRMILAGLARDCASVVQCKERILAAALVIQRAWRKTLDMSAIQGHSILEVQTLARGWMTRTTVGEAMRRRRAIEHESLRS